MTLDFCERLGHRPVARLAVEMPDGSSVVREWCACNAPKLGEPPEWLSEPLRQWPHPQDPVTFSGVVAEGHEDDALAYLTREIVR